MLLCPQDVINNIVDYLDIDDQLNFRLISVQTKEQPITNAINLTYIHDLKLTDKFLENNKISRIYVRDSSLFSIDVLYSLDLTTVIFDYDYYGINMVDISKFKNLQILIIKNNNGFYNRGIELKNLEYLDKLVTINAPCSMDIANLPKNLKYLTICRSLHNESDLWIKDIGQLIHIDIKYSADINNAEIITKFDPKKIIKFCYISCYDNPSQHIYSNFTNVTHLTLHQTKLCNNISLDMPYLKHLVLNCCSGMLNIMKMPQLTSLDIITKKFRNSTPDICINTNDDEIKKIKNLTIKNYKIPDIQKFSQLEKLCLVNMSYVHINPLITKTIKHLKLEYSSCNIDLSMCHVLEKIELIGNVNCSNVKLNCPELRYLYIERIKCIKFNNINNTNNMDNNNYIKNIDHDIVIHECPKLKIAIIEYIDIINFGLDKCNNLIGLSIKSCTLNNETELFRKLKKLRMLRLYDCTIMSSMINGLNNLELLDLQYVNFINKINDSGIILPKLKLLRSFDTEYYNYKIPNEAIIGTNNNQLKIFENNIVNNDNSVKINLKEMAQIFDEHIFEYYNENNR